VTGLTLAVFGFLAFTVLQYAAISNGYWPPGGCCYSGDRPGWSDWSYLPYPRSHVAERLLSPAQPVLVQPLEALLRANWMRMYERRGRYIHSLVAWQEAGQSSRAAKFRWDISFAAINTAIWVAAVAVLIGAWRLIGRKRDRASSKSLAAQPAAAADSLALAAEPPAVRRRGQWVLKSMNNRRNQLVWAVTGAALACALGTMLGFAFLLMLPILRVFQVTFVLGGLASIVGLAMSVRRPRLRIPIGINACVLLFNVGLAWLLATSTP
jgi:hypothetical protein